jgi:hypothetical protein
VLETVGCVVEVVEVVEVVAGLFDEKVDDRPSQLAPCS